MAKKKLKSSKDNKSNTNNNKNLKAFIASFFTLIGFLIAILAWRNDKYVMYYANHGLILFLSSIIINIISPLSVISKLAWLLWFILWIITWINALSGKRKHTLIITDLAKQINIYFFIKI